MLVIGDVRGRKKLAGSNVYGCTRDTELAIGNVCNQPKEIMKMPNWSDLDSEKADVAKLHGEINQLVNQRFLLTAGAITAFALLSRGIILRHDDPSYYLANTAAYAGLGLVLIVLYIQSRKLRTAIRIYSTYLRARNLSLWETDWKNFRDNDKTSYIAKSDLAAHNLIFAALSLASLFFGVLLLTYLYPHEPMFFTCISWSLGVLANAYLFFNVTKYGLNPTYEEEDIRTDWCTVIKCRENSELPSRGRSDPRQ